MKKWNVAIIGLGFVGKLHYDALRRLPNVHVRTIVVHKAQDIPLVKESYDADVDGLLAGGCGGPADSGDPQLHAQCPP